MTDSESPDSLEPVTQTAADADETMATLGDLASMLKVSVRALRLAFEGEPRGRIRFARRKPARGTLYAVSDVRGLVETRRAWFDQRRRQADQLEAIQRAARVERRTANIAKSDARHKARAGGPGVGRGGHGATVETAPPRSDPRARTGPEIIVRPSAAHTDRG